MDVSTLTQTSSACSMTQPLTPKDELEPHAHPCWNIPKPHPSSIDAYRHVAIYYPILASTSPIGSIIILATIYTSTATCVDICHNPPDWDDINISRLPKVCKTTLTRSTSLSNGGVQHITAPPLCSAQIRNPIGGLNKWHPKAPVKANGLMPI